MSLSIIYTEGTTAGMLTLDASLSEAYSASAEVTEHPVETGSAVVDHVRPRPREVRVEGLITEQVVTSDAPADRDRPLAAYERLSAILEAGQPVNITSGLTLVENVVMTSLDVPRDRSTGRALRFSATFREIRFATSETVELPPSAPQKKVKAGDKSPKEPKPKAKAKARRTLGRYLADVVGGRG